MIKLKCLRKKSGSKLKKMPRGKEKSSKLYSNRRMKMKKD